MADWKIKYSEIPTYIHLGNGKVLGRGGARNLVKGGNYSTERYKLIPAGGGVGGCLGEIGNICIFLNFVRRI